MKNFKKVIAFLMVAAMTLGMGTIAFAEEATETSVSVSKIEEAKAGDVVTLNVVASKEMRLSAFNFVFALNPELVETSDAVIKTLGSNWDEEEGDWSFFKAFGPKLIASNVANDTIKVAGAEPRDRALVAAGTTILSVSLKLKADVAAGDVIATVSQPDGYTDDSTAGKFTYAVGEEVQVVVSEKTTTVAPTTAATETTAATTAAAGTTAAATTAAATTAATTTATEIKTAEQALAALTDLSKATAAAAKLNKASFASEADYNAFVAAYEAAKKVLNNPKATDAEKAAAKETLTKAMAKANETALVAAAKAVVAAPATTAKASNTKTGDTAPVAALMLVAIAAFGTAVVVYRKKVNA